MTPPDPIHSPLDPADAIRAQADGEAGLTPGTGDPADDRARIAFEQDLRKAVARVMGSTAAPDSLRQAVITAIRSEPDLRLTDDPFQDNRVYPDRLPFLRQLWYAAAAAIVIFVGVLAVVGTRPQTPAPAGAPQTASLFPLPRESVIRLVSFMHEQHDRCAAFDQYFERKMRYRTPSEAAQAAIELISRVPSVLELGSESLTRAGYTFAGIGPCRVPGEGRSAHLIYRVDPAVNPAAPAISLFVQEDTGALPIEKNCCYYTDKAACKGDPDDCSRCVVRIWRDGGLIYYLIAPAELCDDASSAFRLPARERPLL